MKPLRIVHLVIPLLVLIAAVLIAATALANPVKGAIRGGVGYYGGAVGTDICLPDDIDIQYGGTCSTPDYWFVYDSSDTRLELWTTDSDGAGADVMYAYIEDGTDDWVYAADLAMGGNLTLTAGGSVVTTSNGDLVLAPNGSGVVDVQDAPVYIGDGTYSWGHTPILACEGILEVDGVAYLDGGTQTNDIGILGAGGCTGPDSSILLDYNGLARCTRLSDVPPKSIGIHPQHNYRDGTQDAAPLNLCGGQDETSVTIVAINPSITCAGKFVRVYVTENGSATVTTTLTEGVSWTASASAPDSCASLAAAVNAVDGVSATCSGLDILLTIPVSTCKVGLLSEDTGCATIDVGTQGDIFIGGTFLRMGPAGTDGISTKLNNQMLIFVNDQPVWRMSSGQFGSNTGTAALFRNETPSATNPNIIPYANLLGYGLGGAPHGTPSFLSVIANDIEVLRFEEASGVGYLEGAGGGEVQIGATTAGLSSSGDLVLAGDLEIHHSEAKGQTTLLGATSEILTFAGNPGDATKVTSGLIADGAHLLAVTSRVNTAGTNCSDMDIGDGVDADLYADATSISVDETTTNVDATANWGNPQLTAGEVTVTGTNGAGGAANCFDMVITITAHYITATAPTSN